MAFIASVVSGNIIDPTTFGNAIVDGVNYGATRNGAGAPSGVGTNGETYYDSTNLKLYKSDGTGWVIMIEPEQVFTPTVTAGSGALTTSSATLRYNRSNGWLTYFANILITTNGTGAGAVVYTLPVSPNLTYITQIVAFGRENNTTGKMVCGYGSGNTAVCAYFDNSYPGFSGMSLGMYGQYRMTTRYS